MGRNWDCKGEFIMSRLRFENGDLLEAKELIKIHQVNCQKTMGSGIALRIKNKYPRVFNKYVKTCEKFSPKELLGRCLIVETEKGSGEFIANIFGQLEFGVGLQTNYSAFENSLLILKGFLINSEKLKHIKSIAFPYKIASDKGGEEWGKILEVIVDAFYNWEGEVVIYKL